MADFKTHLTTSTVVGLAYGGAAGLVGGAPIPACVLGATFCSLSGMLPDIDSGPGRPLREITTFLAGLVPAMLLVRLHYFGVEQMYRILIAMAVYAAIRFGLSNFLKRYTVHRGMFHSLAAGVVFAEFAYLLLYGESAALRLFVAGGVLLGFLSHLLLDEIYSVEWDGRPRLKKSFGTALKLFGKGWWPNVSTYGKLTIFTFLIMYEPGILGDIREGNTPQLARDGAVDAEVQTSLRLPKFLNIPWLNSGDPAAEPPTASLPSPVDETGDPPTAAPLPTPEGQPSWGSPPDPWQPAERTATRPTFQPSPPPTLPSTPVDNSGWRYAPPPTAPDGSYRR